MQEPDAEPTTIYDPAGGRIANRPRGAQRKRRRPLPDTGSNARPLGAYAALVGAFMSAHAAATLLGRRPAQLGLPDMLALALATFRFGRMVAQDEVTTFMRAPFVELSVEGSGDDASVREEPTGTGLRVALGQLLTCSTCSAFWGAGFQVWGLLLAPRLTRPLIWVVAANGAGELIELVAENLQKAQQQA